tara:strand:- start:13860 stop:14933 length:1074 start_codon:yes stop_codon:yes gene_type:complete
MASKLKYFVHYKDLMKILHCPNNISGTPRALAELERENGFESLSISTSLIEIDGPSDKISKPNKVSKIFFRLKYFCLALIRFDIINCHAGASLLPLNLDLPFLKLFGKKVIFHYYGSEVRLLKLSKSINPFFSLLGKDEKHKSFLDLKKILKLKWHSLWVNAALAPRDTNYFVSYCYSKSVEGSLWCGNIFVSDIEKQFSEFKDQKSIPTIIHCPTNRATKGSDYVKKTIDKLLQDGYKFKYIEKEKIEREKLLQIIYEEVDIVLDQFLVGSFGNLALETLALGKVSVSYLNETLCKDFSDDCPIVSASVESLYDVLSELIPNQARRVEISKLGKVYIKANLDKQEIMRRLNQIYVG